MENHEEVAGSRWPSDRRFVTIREVADDAKVGVATVSRALNNSGYVASEVRERILASARRLGYRPSERARSMRNLRTMTLGVLMPELFNPVNLEFLRGVEEVARRNGYVTVIGNSQRDAARETSILERLVAERVDGIVLGSMVGDAKQIQAITRQGIPVVPPYGPAGRQLNQAWTAAESGATEVMARRLLELGHRRVCLVVQDRIPVHYRYRTSRADVLAAVLGEEGAELSQLVIQDLRAAEVIAAQAREPDAATAYVAASHLMAPVVLLGLKSAGLDIPDDVTFVSYGDSQWAAAHRPGLSVISHDVHGEATQLTEMLIECINDGHTTSTVSYAASFVERESCGPARRQAPARLRAVPR